MKDFVDTHLSVLDLDIRKSHNARFMDQKVTHDNLSFICDCIRNFLAGDLTKQFTVRDIWDSQYFRVNVVDIYGKPDPVNKSARSEYDKFIGQPMRLLAYAGIVNGIKQGRGYVYTTDRYDILEYIALSQINALRFLDKYLTKILVDSGQGPRLDRYTALNEQGVVTNSDLLELRDNYIKVIHGNTEIKKDYEPRRIFNKIINILAAGRRIRGIDGGKISDFPIVFKDLEYNAVNWRDRSKRKDLSRKEARDLTATLRDEEKIKDYEMKKIKDATKKRFALQSEIKDNLASGSATNVHHIFTESAFPKYRATAENLILLTASQHYTRAHPNHNTQKVDADYQRLCLLAKADAIEDSILREDGFYSLEAFIDMLNENKGLGLSLDASIAIVKDKLTQY